jgi:hypothetical protein
MATTHSTLTQYPLGERPANWASHRNHFVLLSYAVDGSGALMFSYIEAFTQPASSPPVAFSEFAILSPSVPAPILDLEVYDDCFLEIWLNPRQNWQWSRNYDAITTKKDYSKLYFELRYRDGSDLYERADFPTNKTPLVARFGAIHDQGGTPGTKHGFSMNLELLFPTGDPLPITIDPDIQNPKV